MHIILEIALAALLAHLLAGALGISFWMAAIAVVGLYFLATRGGMGLGGAGAGVFNGIGNLFTGVRTFVITVAVFAAIMMIATYVIGVSNSYATNEFVNHLGWRFWLWPSGYSQDLLMWVSAAFLVAGIAAHTAHGNGRVAAIVFGTTLVLMFGLSHLPRTMAGAIPTTLPAADRAIARDGIIPVGNRGVWKLSFGITSATKAVVPRAWRVTRRFLFGEPAPATARPASSPVASAPASTTTVVVQRVGKKMKPYIFDATGCAEMTLLSDADFYPKGGWVTIYPPPPAAPWDDQPGTHNAQSGTSKPAGQYKVCRKDVAAWGVDIWN